MKAIIEFNLPEEEEEYKTKMRAGDYYSVIWNVLQEMRAVVKYDKPGFDADEAQKWREYIYQELGNHGIADEF